MTVGCDAGWSFSEENFRLALFAEAISNFGINKVTIPEELGEIKSRCIMRTRPGVNLIPISGAEVFSLLASRFSLYPHRCLPCTPAPPYTRAFFFTNLTQLSQRKFREFLVNILVLISRLHRFITLSQEMLSLLLCEFLRSSVSPLYLAFTLARRHIKDG